MANTVDINAPLLQREVRNVQTPPSALGSVGLPSNMNTAVLKLHKTKSQKQIVRKKLVETLPKQMAMATIKKVAKRRKEIRIV